MSEFAIRGREIDRPQREGKRLGPVALTAAARGQDSLR
jgi:hypothetical protein